MDLIGHTSKQPVIFGLYSVPLFIFIVLYGCMLAVWIVLFVSPQILARAVAGIRYIQSKTWLVLTLLVGLGLTLWVLLEWDEWSRFPGLQFSAFAMALLAAAILIFSGWNEHRRGQRWRKVIGYPLLALVAIEAVIQIVALFGMLPGSHRIGGNFVPYERVYQNEEGFRNDIANRYGWYYPDARLNDEAKRIIIFGTSQAQALQVAPEQQTGALLSELINQSQP